MSESNNNQGFSLIETMVAMLILTIGILAIAKIFPLATQISKGNERVTVAVNLAQAKIEEITALDYNELEIGTIEPKSRLAEDSENPFYQYQRQTEVVYVDEDINPTGDNSGLKKITVTVFWTSPLVFTEKNLEISTLISQQ